MREESGRLARALVGVNLAGALTGAAFGLVGGIFWAAVGFLSGLFCSAGLVYSKHKDQES